MVFIQIFIVSETSNDFIFKTLSSILTLLRLILNKSDGRYVHILELYSNQHSILILLSNPNFKFNSSVSKKKCNSLHT